MTTTIPAPVDIANIVMADTESGKTPSVSMQNFELIRMLGKGGIYHMKLACIVL